MQFREVPYQPQLVLRNDCALHALETEQPAKTERGKGTAQLVDTCSTSAQQLNLAKHFFLSFSPPQTRALTKTNYTTCLAASGSALCTFFFLSLNSLPSLLRQSKNFSVSFLLPHAPSFFYVDRFLLEDAVALHKSTAAVLLLGDGVIASSFAIEYHTQEEEEEVSLRYRRGRRSAHLIMLPSFGTQRHRKIFKAVDWRLIHFEANYSRKKNTSQIFRQQLAR